MLVSNEPKQDYFFFLYMTYVGLQVCVCLEWFGWLFCQA